MTRENGKTFLSNGNMFMAIKYYNPVERTKKGRRKWE